MVFFFPPYVLIADRKTDSYGEIYKERKNKIKIKILIIVFQQKENVLKLNGLTFIIDSKCVKKKFCK